MKLLTRFMLPCLILSALLIACENPNNVTTPDAKTPSEAEKSKSAITDLSDLTVSEGTLTPTFNASITSYTVEVPSSVSTIKVTGKLKDSKAKISTNNGTNTTVEVGETVIKLEVTAENGTDKKSYVVTVSKTQTTVTNPEYVSENIGTLKPIYPGKFQYDKTTTNIAEITKPYRIGEKEITRKQF
ncbi:MAG TPA: cadherin-like beta sandwich domain-containing protein, partial [Treponemataceae bacterium]|nr:cadherin-like beta sandwich domain-containing protein [Treponemataceae bacterium]